MGKYGAFDIIGPRMIGPSSSHTAGAARLANLAWRIANKDVTRAKLTLFGSFAKTGRGHGTDKALAAGLLGMESDDKRLQFAILLAQEAGIDMRFVFSEEEKENPNCVDIEIESSNGDITIVEGISVGGGSVLITKLNGMSVRISGDYPTLIVHYADSPGVVSKVTAMLALRGINIAFMRVFRKSRRDNACMVIETDAAIPTECGGEILNIGNSVCEVRII